MLRFLRRAGAAPVTRRVLVQDVKPLSLTIKRRALGSRFNSSQSNADKPLGLKEGVKTAWGLSPTMQMLMAYVAMGMSAMGVVARYKSRDAKEDEVRDGPSYGTSNLDVAL